MRGTQDPRGERIPERGGPRVRSRRVYTMRRLLAALALLLLLALLVPRACQALIGSDKDVGSNRGKEAPEKVAGAVGDEEDTAEKADTADASVNDDTKSMAGSEQAKDKDGGEQNGGAAPDLGEILTETLASRVAEPGGTGSDQGVAASGNAGAGQLASTSRQPTPVAERASAGRAGTISSNTAATEEKSPPEPRLKPASGRADEPDSGPVASVPTLKPALATVKRPGVRSVPARVPESVPAPVEPAPAPVPEPEPIDTASVPAAPVAATRVQPTPASVVNDTAFVAAVRPVNNAAAFPRAGTVRAAPAVAGTPVRALP